MDRGKCTLTESPPVLTWFSGQEGGSVCVCAHVCCYLIATKLTHCVQKKKRKFPPKNLLKYCNPARNNDKGGCLQPPSLFSAARVKGALTIYTSAKSEELFQGATSETCLWMHFYINPEIFMLFVKYSCEPVCKLVPGGKVQRNWGDPTHSANNILSCANVASSRDTWGDTNDPAPSRQTTAWDQFGQTTYDRLTLRILCDWPILIWVKWQKDFIHINLYCNQINKLQKKKNTYKYFYLY